MRLVHKGFTDAYLGWGDAWICLLEKKFTKTQRPNYGMDHVAFSIDEDEFSKAVQILKQNKVKLIREPIVRGGGRSVQFADPDGIVLELFTGNLSKRMINWK
jgi:catechol 2,3-dioxygenase-like lactoylglutathione lyase family enzyme